LNLGVYHGLIDPKYKQRRGRGSFLGNDGSLYEGYWLDGNYEGKGRLFNADGTFSEGVWKNNLYQKTGRVIHVDEAGSKFTGSWVISLPQGKGTLETAAYTYEGYFNEGKIEGEGTFTFKNGDVREGLWKNNGLDGEIVETKATESEKYEGSWANGQRSGTGVLSRNGKTIFKGTFANGQYWEGKGSLFESDLGDPYYGAWAEGKPNGQGIITYEDGARYVGVVKDGLPEGRGIKTKKNGNAFDGSWTAGKLFGTVKVSFVGGLRYVGELSEDIPNGSGNMTSANGDLFVGNWIKGNPSSGTKYFVSGDRYVGDFTGNK
jgi:hypothetical protein